MSKINLESLKGTYDRYPDEWATWKYLIEIVDETAEEFGFRQFNPPTIERQELWTEKEEDSVTDEMYAFTDKGDNEITLIPEQTPTRARLIQKRKDLKTPVKWYDTSKRWRYEDVTKGRDREFLQGDFDIFGLESVEADAEIIAAAATIFKKLDLDDRVKFKIGDRVILEEILQAQGVSELKEVTDIIDDKEKMSDEEFVKEVTDVIGNKMRAQTVLQITENSGDLRSQVELIKENEREFGEYEESSIKSRLERLDDLADALEAHGVYEMCEFDLSIVRGLAYYTGLVFEAFDSEGELRALFGGGRYDELVGTFGDREVPAVGFAFGYSPTIELLKKEDRYPLKDVETDVYVLSVSESVRDTALDYATKLRRKGLSVETDLAGRGFGSQLGYADDMNAKRVLIVGERDLENDEVTMKHMESGEEETLDKDEVVEHLESEDFI
ncbi:histidine--tRNA ligase [Candidatus Nanohalobium constans]|uniref:Histidine--tRNA ligase n=1 Tax=Candidatus Nanohalobium constans TaxID=2565781 RepID=A0A5Q0UFV6_9ARCH|nr:histidine--tRNA ligase [Candidatus Nanohalobium constans]QGA80512.1 histidyl-tRNA synthetase [Candidatus Nanohalobium constans]